MPPVAQLPVRLQRFQRQRYELYPIGRWHLRAPDTETMKTHVLLLSKKFLKGHRREGELTEFRKHFLNGTKIHTVRENYEYWAPRIREVMEGVAILSIRQWIDEPYKKPGQIEIGQLTNTSGIGYQR